MRLIDADALKIEIACLHGSDHKMIQYLNHAPTVDAVPVIRCKDCVNRGTMYINMEPVKWRCMISDSVVDMMDYCSFAEREEE